MRMCKQEGYTHVKVLDSVWYQPNTYRYLGTGDVTCIGIVKVQDTITSEIKQYIGYGKGENLEHDEDLIIAGGDRFYGEIK